MTHKNPNPSKKDKTHNLIKINTPEEAEKVLKQLSEFDLKETITDKKPETLPSPWTVVEPKNFTSSDGVISYLKNRLKGYKKEQRYRLSQKRDITEDNLGLAEHHKSGFHPIVDSINTHQLHTLDVTNFVDVEVSLPVAETMKGGITVELHQAGVKECLGSLKKRGFDEYYDIKTPWGPPLFLAINKETDEMAFALANIYGENFLIHYQAMFKYAGLRPEKIKTVGYDLDYKQQIKDSIKDTPASETVLLGGLLMGRYIERRMQITQDYIHLRDHLQKYQKDDEKDLPLNRVFLKRIDEKLAGLNGKSGREVEGTKKQYKRIRNSLGELMGDQEAETLFATDPTQLFRDGISCERMFAIAETISSLKSNNLKVEELPIWESEDETKGKKRKIHAFPPKKEYLEPIAQQPLMVKKIKYQNSDGQEKSIAFTEFPYGDMTYNAAKAFLENGGVKHMAIIGSAGSNLGIDNTDVSMYVGDIGVPIDLYRQDGVPVGPNVENKFLDLLEDDIKKDLLRIPHESFQFNDPFLIPTSHLRVETPFLETKHLVDNWKTGYFDSVDCEIPYVVEAIEEFPGDKPEFGALTFMEDVIGVPGFTLGEINRKQLLDKTRTKIVDILLGGPLGSKNGSYFDIAKIHPSPTN